MKKLFTFLFCVMLGISAFAQQKIQLRSADRAECTKSDMTSLKASFSFSTIETEAVETKGGDFAWLSMPNTVLGGNEGDPQIPVVNQLIAVPVGAEPTITVTSYSTKEYNLTEMGVKTLIPRQPSLRKNQNPEDVPFVMNQAAYQTRGLHSEPQAFVEAVGIMRGVRLGKMTIEPVSYDPVNNTLRVFNDIEVEVSFNGADAKATEDMLIDTYSPYFDIVYKQLFNNRAVMDAYTDHPDLYKTPVKMLVVATSTYTSTAAFQNWLNWKRQKGIDVDIYTVTSSTASSTIRSEIQNRYNTNHPTFLVIVGDETVVKAYKTDWSCDSYYGKCINDMEYASVDNDVYHDMYMSRMSVSSTTELGNLINKILTYEQYTMSDPSYLNNSLLVAGWDDYWTNQVGKPTIQYANNNYYNSAHGITPTVYITTASGQTAAWNNINNVGFINYTAHGDIQELSDPVFSNTNASNLTNNGKYFWLVANCCLSANWGNNTYKPCLGETLIRAANKGAFGYIGSIPETLWYEDYYFGVGAFNFKTGGAVQTVSGTSVGMYDAAFDETGFNCLNAMPYIGNVAVTYAHARGYSSSVDDEYYWRAYQTLGDGSVMPYLKVPAANNVSHNSTIPAGSSTFRVNADAGSYVSITVNNNIIGVAAVPANATYVDVPFTTTPQAGQTAMIVVTRNQRQPYINNNVQVVGGTQYTITADANNAAWGTVTGGGQYYNNTECTLTATANHGYAFERWNDNNTDNPRTITVTGNATYTANFRQLTQHHCTYTAQQTNGTIGVSPANAYAGDIVTLTATPDAGYVLDYWEVNTVSKGDATGTDFRSLATAMIQQDKSAASNGNVNAAASNMMLPNSSMIQIDRGINNRGNVTVIDNQFIMPDSEVTISAVFREESVSDITYDLVTESQTDWSGNYVLATSLSSTSTTVYAFDGDTEDNAGGFTGVTVDNNSIASIGNAAVLTIAKSTVNSSYYSIRINGGDYLADGQSGIETSSTESNYTNWNITYTSNGIQINCPVWSGGPYYFYFVVYEEISSGNIAGAIYLTTDGSTTSTDTYNIYYFLPNLYKEHNAQEQGLTVYDGTATNQYIPMYGLYFDDYTKSECIIPATVLTDMVGCAITAITFYPSSVNSNAWTGSEQTVFLKEVSGTTLGGSYSGTSGATTVKVGSPLTMPTAGSAYTITFDTPYTYNGDNLLIGVYNDDGSSYNSVYWYGTSGLTSGVSAYGYNGSSLNSVTYNAQSFLPKTTFTYLLAGHNVTAGTMSNGSVQFSINGGVNWSNSLTNVAAGETVVISVDPEQGFELSGAPTVTPACTVTGSGNLYSFTMPDSNVTVNATFNCTTPADPTFSVATGTYTTAQNVSISCATAGATIYYTTDGSTPTDSSTQYTEAITILETTILKAIAYIGTCTSNVATATYTMELPTYTVTCATGLTGGSIVANHATAAEGITVTVTATPENGYFLGTITATDANYNDVPVTVNGNEGTFTMPAANVTVTATFTSGYNITLNQTDHGTISADQTTQLQPGDVVTLTATPDNGCVFLAWYVFKDGNPRDVVAVVNNSWFFMPASDVTVRAIFVTEEEHEQTVGSGNNTSSYLPTYVYRRNICHSLTQQIYTAAEIGYNGRITAIAFKASGSATRTLDIYMAHTTKTAFSATNDWEVMGSVAKVFSGSVSFTSNWVTITLDTPFEYDGTSNLNICVVDVTSDQVNSTRTFSAYSTGANRALRVYSTGNSATDYSSVVGYSDQLDDIAGTYSTSNNQIKFTIKVPGSAESLTVSPSEMNDFSYIESHGPSQTHKLDILGVDLAKNVTINAPTNFEVCLTEDGIYASSVTVPRTTSKRNRSVQTWDFEDGLQDWTVVDADGDGYNWAHNTSFGGYDGSTGLVYSQSYDNSAGALTPDNWLISPQVTLGGSFSMWAHPQQAAYPAEHFAIEVSTTDANPSSFTLLGEWTLSSGDWKQFSVDLSAFAGRDGYIAVRHFNSTDQFYINVDEFVLDSDAAITIEMPVTITAETVFVRMKDNLNPGNYSGALTGSAGTGDNLNGSVSLSGEVIAEYDVTLAANPVAGGSVAGAGSYPAGTEVTVAARTNTNYHFVNWTENGNPVSTDASYTFTISADRDLVANFELDTFVIAATANPAAGGAVSGTGTFDYGTSVTVHATVVAGYTFVNWTENNVEVSTNADYTFTVETDRTLVANFLLNSYEITATATTGGMVSGAGTYNHGATATLVATPDANYNFVNWTENDVEVSTEATYSFTVEADRTLVANFELATVDQVITLVQGYNWFTPSVEMTLEDLETALGENGVSIMTKDETVTYYAGYGWWGDDITIVPGQMYKIETATACSITINGQPAEITNYAVTLNKGYNWIGYFGTQNMTVVSALANLQPEDGDVIMDKDLSATYYAGYGWWGDLETLVPGKGYLYKSNANATKTFYYPSSSK